MIMNFGFIVNKLGYTQKFVANLLDKAPTTFGNWLKKYGHEFTDIDGSE
jgi:hypothetical protein